MSINLCFTRKKKKRWEDEIVDFPFQTPTELTNKVYDNRDKPIEEILQIIEDYIRQKNWDQCLKHLPLIEEMLADEDLELDYI